MPRPTMDERDAPPLALESELLPAAVFALTLAGRHRGRRAHRHVVRLATRLQLGGALGRELPARADVVLDDMVRSCVGDVDALAVGAHRYPKREAVVAGGHRRRALGRELPARADVVLGDRVG